jgi:hypothetical protein
MTEPRVKPFINSKSSKDENDKWQLSIGICFGGIGR